MSSENIPPPSKTPNTTTNMATKKEIAAQKTAEEQQQPPLKCPRCDSSNTKFCYYNNYSLTQPRHFCKTCRRYWTRGGALRNVPIGGGCRKTKRHKPSPSASCGIASAASAAAVYSGGPTEYRFLSSSTPPTVGPAMEFQLGGLSLPRLHPATAGVFTQFIANSGAHSQTLSVGPGTGGCYSLDLLGLGATYQPVPNTRSSPPPLSNSLSMSMSMSLAGGGGGGGGIGGDHTISISSIESLSSINQEMHWKLQQQRLAMIYGHSPLDHHHHHHQSQDDNQQQQQQQQDKSSSTLGGGGMSLFKNLESGKKLDATTCPTEWLFNQLQTNPSTPPNYGATNDNNDFHNSVITNNHQDFNGVWTTEVLHQQQQHHHLQFNGMQ